MARKLTKEEFLSRSKYVWGENTFDYSKVEYVNSQTKVSLICTKHGIEFEQIPSNHLKGCIGCDECLHELKGQYKSGYWSYERCYKTAKKYEWLRDFTRKEKCCYFVSRENDYLKDFIWLKRCYDENENIVTSRKHLIYKYEFLQFNSIYIGLTIDLEQRHRFHCAKGSVYNFCKTNNLVIPKPQIAEDNLTLEESKVREAFWIEKYRRQGYKLLNKAKAGSVGMLSKIRSGNETNEFVLKAKQVHGDKYDYSKVVYVNSDTKVIITCPLHGDFEQVTYSHLIGKGCPGCSKNRRLTTEEFIKRARSVHGDKYGYGKVEYKNAKGKVIIICPTHGDFLQEASSHLQGSGCPKCSRMRKK